jgi:DNA-directed RNA polymerase subunit F
MTCLGKKRTLLTTMPIQRGKNEFASGVRHSLAGSFLFLAAWMIFLSCGLGWAGQCSAGPCPDQARSLRKSVAWYPAGQATPGNGGGYAGGAVVQPAPPQPEREHLGEWLRQHQNMSFQEQERALRTEPGFNRLPPAKQQKLLERLQQLDAMPPARRERMLARLETWERLSPEQRQQVRVGILEVHQMPFDRQVMIHRAVRDLSEFPQWQRGDILNSPEFRHHYSDYERQVLATLMMAQPYEPLRTQ